MRIDLHRTLEELGGNLPRDGRITFGMLEKAYELTLRLRSQLLGALYDRIDFGSAPKRIVGEVSATQNDSVVCLTIPEPLPGLKELTGTVEEHWTRLIHEAIAQQSKPASPTLKKPMSTSASPLPKAAITTGYGTPQTEPSMSSSTTSRVSFSTMTISSTCPSA